MKFVDDDDDDDAFVTTLISKLYKLLRVLESVGSARSATPA